MEISLVTSVGLKSPRGTLESSFDWYFSKMSKGQHEHYNEIKKTLASDLTPGRLCENLSIQMKTSILVLDDGDDESDPSIKAIYPNKHKDHFCAIIQYPPGSQKQRIPKFCSVKMNKKNSQVIKCVDL